jgi:hypothetical protein
MAQYRARKAAENGVHGYQLLKGVAGGSSGILIDLAAPYAKDVDVD